MNDLLNHVDWLRARRAELLALATELTDCAARQNRYLSLYEQRQYEQLVDSLDHLDNRLRRLWIQHRTGADSVHSDMSMWFRAKSGGSFAYAPGSGTRATLGWLRR
jgi:hypothetical protein